jgi:nitrite reductase (NO-forming)
VIGEIFDRVRVEGGDLVNTNLQTTLIPPGGTAIVEFKCEVPGTFILVDHAIFRTFNKGALAMLEVQGPKDPAIYSEKQSDLVYLPEGQVIQTMGVEAPDVPPARNKAERIERGERTYRAVCAACHQPNGEGIAAAFPPLAKSDYLNADKRRAIGVVVHGLTGEIQVNGKSFNSVMPSLGLTDEVVANVLTYVYSRWGNAGHEVTADEVKAVRAQK